VCEEASHRAVRVAGGAFVFWCIYWTGLQPQNQTLLIGLLFSGTLLLLGALYFFFKVRLSRSRSVAPSSQK
jgi:hypothetical protein